MKKRAFTLIELLVVIAIVAILAAILFPVFARAKEAAKKTVCVSQVKQIGMAWLLYGGDYDDTLMRVSVGAGTERTYWWGRWDGAILHPSQGLLFPYIKSTALDACPTFDNRLRGPVGRTGYGYNYAYLSPSTFAPPAWEETPRARALRTDRGACRHHRIRGLRAPQQLVRPDPNPRGFSLP